MPRAKLFGWADGYEIADGGDAVLRYDTNPLRYGIVIVQVLFWIVALVSLRRATRVRGDVVLPSMEAQP